jgi:hypothetical protein
MPPPTSQKPRKRSGSIKQPDTEEVSMSVDKEHLLTFRTASVAFTKSVQDICQEGVELFLDNKLPITDESRNRYKDSAIYTIRLPRQLVARLKQGSDKRDVPVSVMFRAWAIELNRRHKFEINYLAIDFAKFLPKDLSAHEEIQAVEVVKGKKFVARIHIPIEPPFKEGDKYAKGRKVVRIDLDKQGKYWVLYVVNA